jgi:hypothetical protein
MDTYTANLPLMKRFIHLILDALFFPKPHDYLKRNHQDSQYGNGLILVPIPNKSKDYVDQIRQSGRK